MAGNRVSCGSQLEDMQHHPRVSSRASNGKSSTYTRASKGMAVDERGSSRLHSRSINSFHRAGMRSIVSHSKYSTGLTKLESSSLSSSSSSSPPSFLLGPKDPQISLSPDLQSAMHCQSVSSDESGSDSDIEVAERMASILPAVKGTAGRNSSGSSSTGGFVVPFKGECMERGLGSLPRQRRIQCAGMLNWEDHHASFTSDARSVHVATGSAFSFDQERLCGIAAVKAPHNSLLTGSSSPHRQCIDEFTAPLGEKVRPGVERVCNSGIEVGAFGSGQHPQRSGISVDSSQSLGQLIGSTRGSECKRKTGGQGVLGRRLRPMTSQGVGFRESNSTAIGLAHGGGLSRRNLSSLSCSSAADVLPSVSNSSAARAPEQMRHRRIVGTPGLNNAGGALGGTRSGMSRVASGSSGCVWHMVSHKSSGGPSTELNLRRVDPQSGRPVRREHSGFQPDTRCPRRLLSLDSGPMASSTASNTSTAFGNAQLPLLSCRHRGSGPSVSRGRNSLGALARSSEHFLDSAIAFSEELPNRFAGNSSRISSRSSARTNLFETVGVESGNSSRGRADSLFSSSAMACLPEVQFTQSGLSGPPPLRPPPLPPFGSTLAHSSTSQIALSPPSFSTSSPHIPYCSRSPGFLSSDDQERQDSSAAEPAAYDAFQGFQLHSIGENQARLTVDGLSEILSALEHVERDEELSYEQVLMLEATILLGGIGIHDQHRDMRLDVDNMSYEELLALEERMGNVSTGLNEQNIEKCVKKIQYASFEKTVDYVPQDIEVKCSVCQEEFQDDVELGLLECGHSHHIACIKQWLLQKNQCPICKAAASA